MKNQSTVVTYNLEASQFPWEIAAGKTISAWGFNGQLPGPTIKAKKGDTVVVRVKNSLTEPTMVHWHGVRLPAVMDGTGDSQKPILPGEEYEYSFVVPDAGTFWYHSHANETVQMERGMYGALIVEDPSDPTFDNDRVFMVDDMKLTKNNEFLEHGWFLPKFIERHDGREGNVALLNGKEMPIVTLNAGQTERWRFINASSARYFVLHLGGHTFQLIGTDGGLIETPQVLTKVLITPGERIDIAVGAFEDGDTFSIESPPYDRTTFLKASKKTYGTVNVVAVKASTAYVPISLREIEALAPQDAEVTRKVKLSVAPNLKNGLDFRVNDRTHMNDAPVFVGDLQVWEVSNTSLMDHPFHLHGFFFQVLEENGKAPGYKAWKDTINLKPRTTVKIAWMPDNRPGRWMYHCHIIEHHEAGMMASFDVVDRSKPYMLSTAHHCHS
ncbi:MAG TPA: multicopper oxidase family protein [Flavipsychrobacter sp.]|nr:multicopper oxidase family protein [Flavipsychrobacter sp.]